MFPHPHFTITKNKTHYVRLTVVLAIAGFVAIMTAILLVLVATDAERLQVAPAARRSTTLALQATRTEVSPGEIFGVSVLLTSDVIVTGVDVVLQYDPTILALEPRDPAASASADRYLGTALSVLDLFPYAEITKSSETSTSFFFSALAKPLRNFRGQGEVASLRFRALKAGETAVSFLFQPGASSDSNVASQGQDILTAVHDLTIKVR